jgi:predicted P-loop ATPase
LIEETDRNKTLEKVQELLHWKEDSRGKPKIVQSVRNQEIVLENDPYFKGKIRYNEFDHQTYLIGTIPNGDTEANRPLSIHDDSNIFSILQNDYGLNSRQDYYDAIKNVSMRHKFHPVRNFFESLEWNGKEDNIRKLLPDYLGVPYEDEYSFEVMKLQLLAGINRVFHPGCKYDTQVILQGRQGLGKSMFCRRLSPHDEWYTDSLDGLDGDKAAQLLLGTFICEFGELTSLAKTSSTDAVKRFLSAQSDKMRLPYEKRAEIFPRQCIFFGTTNRSDYLMDETGNRRFLIIQVGQNEPTKSLFSDEAKEDFSQAWAEAYYIFRTQNPELVLPEQFRQRATELQEECLQDDGKIGIIKNYLENKDRVCAIEVWYHALHEQSRPKKWQTSEINNIIAGFPEWKRIPYPTKFDEYGSQRGFQKLLQCSSESFEEFQPIDADITVEIPFS